MLKRNKILLLLLLPISLLLSSFYYDDITKELSYYIEGNSINYLMGEELKLNEMIDNIYDFTDVINNQTFSMIRSMNVYDDEANTIITTVTQVLEFNNGYLKNYEVNVYESDYKNTIYSLSLANDKFTLNNNTGYDFSDVSNSVSLKDSSYTFSIEIEDSIKDSFMSKYEDSIGLKLLYGFKYTKYNKVYVKADTNNPLPVEAVCRTYLDYDTYIYDTNYMIIDGMLAKGVYYAKRLTNTHYGEIFLEEYEIEAYDFNSEFNVENICVRYNDPIDEIDYRKFIESYTDYEIISISSSYFTSDKSKLGKYRVIVKVSIPKYSEILTRISTIEVIDDESPQIEVISVCNIDSDKILVDSNLLSCLNYHDDYDGDNLRYEIVDLDDYKNNSSKAGNYRFQITVFDTSDNYASEIVVAEVKKIENTITTTTTNEENKDYEIEDVFKTTTNESLTKDFLKRKLVLLGYFDSKDYILLTSDYFSNASTVGEYLLVATDNINTYYFNISVSKADVINNNINDSITNKEWFWPVVIGGGVIVLILFVILYNKKKKGK